jgi:subtilisin family serine protease
MRDEIRDTLNAVGYAKVLVALQPQAIPAAAAAAAVLETTLQKHFMIPGAEQIAGLARAAVRRATRRVERLDLLKRRAVRVYPNLGLALGFVDRAGAAALEADQRVRDVLPAPELSLIRPFSSRKARVTAPPTWGIERLKIPQLWAAGLKGKGVLIGHLDTGVDGTHPALKNAIAAFAEFDLSGEPVAGAKPTDSGDHGTHTAGTIVGRGNPRGAFGVAPEAKLVSGMVIEGGQVIDRVLAGMDWVLGRGVRVLSLSLGLRGFTPAFQAITDALRRQNTLPIFAVGNEGVLTSRSPGNYSNVLSIGAIDENDQVADFSSSQEFDRSDDPLVPDIVAPGVDVLSCVPGGFARMSGTSMATPHVAGLAGLLLQAKPDASADELEAAILASCSRPNSIDQVRGNRGVPDAVVALEALTGQSLAKVA